MTPLPEPDAQLLPVEIDPTDTETDDAHWDDGWGDDE